MGFKRLVSLACDGPCGTVLEGTTKAPAGWVKVSVSLYERLETNQKPTHPPQFCWLCPGCWAKTSVMLEQFHVCLNGGGRTEEQV